MSILFLIAQMLLVPYRKEELQFLSCASQLVIVVLLIGSTFMFIYQHFSVALASSAVEVGDDADPVVSVLVFESLDGIALLCLVAMGALTIGLCALTARRLAIRGKDELLRIKATKSRPQVSIAEGLRYHLFLSHVWGTGQDQAAVLKRQLLRMVPGLSVFLDVDDLADIGNLEGYIDESMSVLMFLSRGVHVTQC